MTGLTISDVAARTGIAAGTLRIWEQRHGFPEPGRTPSGYRRYPESVVDVLRQVVELREQGLSVPAAIARAREADVAVSDRPSMYAALTTGSNAQAAQLLTKRTLVAMSRAIEDEAMSHAAAPVAFGAFQEERFYRAVEYRYQEIARMADAVVVFADFPEQAVRGGVTELPVAEEDALGNEWVVVVDAPGYAACLVAWEPARNVDRGGEDDLDRRFEAVWTLDPEVTRRAAQHGARLAGRSDPDVGTHLQGLLAARPLAVERPLPSLTSLTNRIVSYLDER